MGEKTENGSFKISFTAYNPYNDKLSHYCTRLPFSEYYFNYNYYLYLKFA